MGAVAGAVVAHPAHRPRPALWEEPARVGPSRVGKNWLAIRLMGCATCLTSLCLRPAAPGTMRIYTAIRIRPTTARPAPVNHNHQAPGLPQAALPSLRRFWPEFKRS